jgi:squalene-associated FAD-dependent desaturase
MSAVPGKPMSVAVVGGGLAGLAAAAALAARGIRVEVFESRSKLGGRAASFADPGSGELVDHCQHVGMACCTNLIDFCRRTGIEELFRRDRVLHFFGPDGRRYDLAGSAWLPAPLHLLPSLLRLGYLSIAERLGICRAMVRLARADCADDRRTVGEWLAAERQSPNAVERFWAPVLVSALGETVERASLRYARKVFVDGFITNRRAYEIDVPMVPLGELYGDRLAATFLRHGVQLHTGTAVRSVDVVADRPAVLLANGRPQTFDGVIVAVPWRRAAELFSESLRKRLPECERWMSLEAAPISGLHLWFDRPFMELPHAVLVGTLSQWVFSRMGNAEFGMGNDSTRSDISHSAFLMRHFYCQIVISASYELAGQPKEAIVERVVDELRRAFPAARDAQLLRSKLVTEREAVFSVRPGGDALRPSQQTAVPGLYLAGDWTATGWPATMEGAVRSGYLAAEQVLAAQGRPERVVVDDLPVAALARLVIGRRR